MVKCLTQEHNMLVKAGFEPTTFGLRVNSFNLSTALSIYQAMQNCMRVSVSKLRKIISFQGNQGPLGLHGTPGFKGPQVNAY